MRVFITAGDPSADIYAARLMNEIRLREPEVVFEGFGGPNMELQGLHTVAHMSDLAVSGFWEVAKRYQYFSKLLEKCKGLISTRKPDVFVPVDYPGFNMRLASHAKRHKVPVAWYIAPQLWAWGENRAKKLADAVDTLMVVFPFETEFFGKHRIKTLHVGHPMLDELVEQNDAAHPNGPIVMMPGSRKQELHHHVPILSKTIELLRKANVQNPVLVPRAVNVTAEMIKPLISQGASGETDARACMKNASAGLIKAGTSTLEASLMGLPFATFYKTSPLSYQLSKRLVTVDSVTMMNLLLKRKVVDEFIQQRASPELLSEAVQMLMTDSSKRAMFRESAAELGAVLGGPGAAARAADVVCRMVNK